MRPHDYFLRGGARSRRVGSGVRRYRGRRRVHHGRERDRHAHIRARVRYGGRRARAPAPRAIDAECFYLRNDIPVPSERRRYRAGSLSGLRLFKGRGDREEPSSIHGPVTHTFLCHVDHSEYENIHFPDLKSVTSVCMHRALRAESEPLRPVQVRQKEVTIQRMALQFTSCRRTSNVDDGDRIHMCITGRAGLPKRKRAETNSDAIRNR